MFKFNDKEFQKLADKLQRLPDKVKGQLLYKGAQKGAQEVVRHLKKPGGPLNAPSGYSRDSLHYRTGRLAKVRSDVKPQGDRLVIGFGSEAKYAKVHETGAVIRPKNKTVLRFEVSRAVQVKSRKLGAKKKFRKATNIVFTKKVTIPARRPFGRTVEDKRVQQGFVNTMAHSVVEGIKVELNK